MDIKNIAIEDHKLTVTAADGTTKDFLDATLITNVTDEKVTVTKSDGSTEEFDKPTA